MHTEMWEHPAVQDNVATLRRRGVHVLEPAEGRLAGGDFGMGRLREPEEIVAALAAILAQPAAATARAAATLAVAAEVEAEAEGPFAGVRAVVSAGGTREPLDPVRYIGNRSSGKQGYAVAAGAEGAGSAGDIGDLERPGSPGGRRRRRGRNAPQKWPAPFSRPLPMLTSS